jgi:hypothetical protein
MARQKVDLIGSLAIIRGEHYDLWHPQAEGDWTLWTPKSEIRTNLLSSGGELITSFLFGATTYDPETNLTTWLPYLPVNRSSLLTPTKYQGQSDVIPSVRNCLAFDFQISLDHIVKALAPGFVQVIDEVTQNGS